MKLKHLLCFLIVSGLIASCGKNAGKFTISGAVKGMPEQTVILEQLNANDVITIVDSQRSDDKGNFEITSIAPEPGLYRLHFKHDGKNHFILLSIDKGSIRVNADWANIENYSIAGSESSESLRKFIVGIREHLKDIKTMSLVLDTLQAKGNDSVIQIARKELADIHFNFTEFVEMYADTVKHEPNAVFAARMVNITTETNFLEMFAASLPRRYPGTKMTKDFAEYYAHLDLKANKKSETGRVDVGEMAPEINLPKPDGGSVTLSSLKGKYVLVDFWASWCAPCRAESPNLVAAYNKYKDRNFIILSVSLDNQKEKWTSAIKEDGYTWPQVSDLKGMDCEAARLYGVQTVPFNFLLDTTGKVIARDLRGSALENMLSQAIK